MEERNFMKKKVLIFIPGNSGFQPWSGSDTCSGQFWQRHEKVPAGGAGRAGSLGPGGGQMVPESLGHRRTKSAQTGQLPAGGWMRELAPAFNQGGTGWRILFLVVDRQHPEQSDPVQRHVEEI